MESWLQTYTGRKFDPFNPTIEDIHIEDIAHALSQICRFGGHSTRFYSVAEHSLIVSYFCENYPLEGLLHDATEAYIGDMIRPLKIRLNIKSVERKLSELIATKYDLVYPWPDEIKEFDHRILGDEKKLLMTPGLDWYDIGKPLGINNLGVVGPREIETIFLKRFRQLYRNKTLNRGEKEPTEYHNLLIHVVGYTQTSLGETLT